ncbi:MAG: DUF998 domain-containing protein [Bacteroidetes bacterium]|nr:DUF998 domain-containing protein [Bacteroidota bacterium]
MKKGIVTSPHFLLCGAIACPLFLIVVIAEGALRPDYDSFLYPLSSLSIGDTGWTQILNFIFTGILLVVFSFGLKQVCKSNNEKFRGPLLIRLVGFGLIGAGIFITDPVYGYPNDKPLILRQFTLHGHLHDGFSMFVFICLPWACFAFRKYFTANYKKKWANYSAFTGYAMIAALIITSMGFKQLSGFVNYAGIFQRLCISIGWTWMTLLSLYLVKFHVQRVHSEKSEPLKEHLQ